MGLLKKIGKIFKTGRSASKRAEKAANQYAQEAQAQRGVLEEKNKKERAKAQKLAIRGLRSRRAAARFNGTQNGEATTYGSTTIG